MTEIYFIRHSLRDSAAYDDMDVPLTDEGEKRALVLAEAFEPVALDQIYSSPFLRSVRTVQPLAEAKALEIQLLSALRERNVGPWIDDFWSFAQMQWQDFDYKLEQGESLREVQERNIQAVQQILKNASGQKVAVGTHGTSLSTILNYYQPDFQFNDFKVLAGKMPYVIKMDFDGHRYLSHEEIPIDYE